MEFSQKQKIAMTWWRESEKQALICDGAVRSGKTLAMGVGFFLWATAVFRGRDFAICGKTVGAVRRNLLGQVGGMLREMGFTWTEKVSQGTIQVGLHGRINTFYLFGGRDESSAALIQGMTLAGALMDEVVLMPRSFVEQTCARCSVEGARVWFSCNPDTPEHWFYKEWIQKAEEKGALRLHFTMEDNPSLSEKVKQRYRETFQGAFYQRFVLGEWVAAQGLVYDFFSRLERPEPPGGEMEEWVISCDYGTVNPTSMGLWGRREDRWYRMAEYYYDSRAEGRQKTDGEYADALAELAGGRRIRTVIVDPSAASFLEVLRRRGWNVKKAKNDVLSGIRLTAELLRRGKLVICANCEAAAREFGLYRWEEGSAQDKVVQETDHAMDEIRYFAATVAVRKQAGGGVFAGCVRRDGM